ncbi:hypothetical protein ETH_00008990 [Eimeria tenella]|uniref:Uncharacterized protein n=1 Tax=Eimeria tenella TaxID=5802 RepID=U6L382_EIMTE|nr:hypothetical protein ETH_00008990 [Eimeria tenella]CDJ43059.1 hypothetical protein ETH_00008990 [Eimeria tenella]|eukprot:XP_013233809.1 hypothetical protein ETH_00008990 [Eimeria tenella]
MLTSSRLFAHPPKAPMLPSHFPLPHQLPIIRLLYATFTQPNLNPNCSNTQPQRTSCELRHTTQSAVRLPTPAMPPNTTHQLRNTCSASNYNTTAVHAGLSPPSSANTLRNELPVSQVATIHACRSTHFTMHSRIRIPSSQHRPNTTPPPSN